MLTEFESVDCNDCRHFSYHQTRVICKFCAICISCQFFEIYLCKSAVSIFRTFQFLRCLYKLNLDPFSIFFAHFVFSVGPMPYIKSPMHKICWTLLVLTLPVNTTNKRSVCNLLLFVRFTLPTLSRTGNLEKVRRRKCMKLQCLTGQPVIHHSFKVWAQQHWGCSYISQIL